MSATEGCPLFRGFLDFLDTLISAGASCTVCYTAYVHYGGRPLIESLLYSTEMISLHVTGYMLKTLESKRLKGSEW